MTAGHFGNGQIVKRLPCNEEMPLSFEVGPGALASLRHDEISIAKRLEGRGSASIVGGVRP
jgi:hypothetical protein